MFFILTEGNNIPHQLNSSQSYANEPSSYNNLSQPAPYEHDNLNYSHHEYSELSFSGRYDYPYFPPLRPITDQPGRVQPMEFVCTTSLILQRSMAKHRNYYSIYKFWQSENKWLFLSAVNLLLQLFLKLLFQTSVLTGLQTEDLIKKRPTGLDGHLISTIAVRVFLRLWK